MDSLKDQAAIVGVGETVYNRESGRTELSLPALPTLVLNQPSHRDIIARIN